MCVEDDAHSAREAEAHDDDRDFLRAVLVVAIALVAVFGAGYLIGAAG